MSAPPDRSPQQQPGRGDRDSGLDGANATRASIRSSISRRFDIESVSVITARDVTVTKAAGGYEVVVTYSHKAPFVANISFVVDFDKRVLVRR